MDYNWTALTACHCLTLRYSMTRRQQCCLTYNEKYFNTGNFLISFIYIMFFKLYWNLTYHTWCKMSQQEWSFWNWTGTTSQPVNCSCVSLMCRKCALDIQINWYIHFCPLAMTLHEDILFSVEINLWFPKGLWQWLIHYRNTMLDIVHCVRYFCRSWGFGEFALIPFSGTWLLLYRHFFFIVWHWLGSNPRPFRC